MIMDLFCVQCSFDKRTSKTNRLPENVSYVSYKKDLPHKVKSHVGKRSIHTSQIKS